MTPQHEQWECDLIAPSAAPGLAQFTEYFVKNYPGPDTIISDPRWHAPRIFRAAMHAAGQAHPQGPPREPTPEMAQAGRLAINLSEDAMSIDRASDVWQAMYAAAPAASQAAAGAGCTCSRWLNSRTCPIHGTDPPPAAVAVLLEQREYECGCNPLPWCSIHGEPLKAMPAPAAIAPQRQPPWQIPSSVPQAEQLTKEPAPAETAKAQEPDGLYPDWLGILEDRDLGIAEFHAMQRKIARHIRDAAYCIENYRRSHEADAARDTAVALLRECQPWMCDDPDDVTDTTLRQRIDAFLAQAGARGDKGAG